MLAPLLLAASLALPGGNLLLRREVQGRGLSGGAAATDGLLAPEGFPAAEAAGKAAAARLESPDSVLVVDLGAPRTIRALLLQADAGDVYMIERSLDGREWKGLLRVDAGDAAGGMRTRRAELPAPTEVRFLLVHAAAGDGAWAVGELAAFPDVPAAWAEPPPATDPGPPPEGGEALSGLKAALALAAALLAVRGLLLRRRGAAERGSPAQDRALAALGAAAAAAFFNFGLFHKGRFVHVWDAYHYFIGAKYFPELGYKGLYEATLAAERAAGLLPPGARIPIRDLATNALVTGDADDALAVWPSRFGRRWEAFVADVLWFRTRTTPERFRRILLDHGYNATPAWGIAGGLLARATGAATDGSILALALLDPLLLLAAGLLVGRAFGWRAACVALVFWGTNFPGRFWWTGGSFLRMDWLALAMAGVALLRLGRPRLAGAALATATLLRLFPGALLLALGATAVLRLASERRWSAVREELRVAQGALLATLVVVPLSLAASGGFSSIRWTAWSELAANSRKHLATPLTNNVGLGTALSWRPESRGEALVAPRAPEPWAGWKAARDVTLASVRPARLALAAGFVAGLAFAFRRRPAWAAAAAGAGLVFVLADLTCYYASVLLLLGLLVVEREETAVVTSSLAAATGAVPYLLRWEDDRYALVSALVVGAFALLLALHARPEKERPASRAAADP